MAVRVAVLRLEQLAWGMQLLMRLERVAQPGQPPGWAEALVGWVRLLVLQGARLVESPVV